MNNTIDEQQSRLSKTIFWAKRIHADLSTVQLANPDRVHFRPSSSGVAMVGLLPARPQRGKSGLTNLTQVASSFEELFTSFCKEIPQGRETGEKALQSWLLRDAYTHGRKLDAINKASLATDDPVELVFLTDEIALPVDQGEIVCDLLALRVDRGRSTPVVLELKSARMLTRLLEQVDGYSKLVDQHASLFAELYGALLGREVTFDRPPEKWIVWPAVSDTADPRAQELRDRGIRVASYRESPEVGYIFTVAGGN